LVESLALATAAGSGDASYYRDVLESIVKRGRFPGLDASLEWIYPEPLFQARYANLIAQSATHYDEALVRLSRALWRDPYHGEIYHYYADLLWQLRNKNQALLAYRIASCLELENDHYAEAYAWALKKCGELEAAIEWLVNRVERFTGEAGGGSAWMVLVQTLERFCRGMVALPRRKRCLRDVSKPVRVPSSSKPPPFWRAGVATSRKRSNAWNSGFRRALTPSLHVPIAPSCSRFSKGQTRLVDGFLSGWRNNRTTTTSNACSSTFSVTTKTFPRA
jgi:hypothetical protein